MSPTVKTLGQWANSLAAMAVGQTLWPAASVSLGFAVTAIAAKVAKPAKKDWAAYLP